MNWKKHGKILTWTPRVLAIILCVMALALGLDMFDMQSSWLNMILGFLLHGIPAYMLMGVTFVSWKWPLVGGSVFIGLGVLYSIIVILNGVFFTVGLYPILIGLLFIAQYKLLIYKK